MHSTVHTEKPGKVVRPADFLSRTPADDNSLLFRPAINPQWRSESKSWTALKNEGARWNAKRQDAWSLTYRRLVIRS